MKTNKLRKLLNENKPTLGTRVHSIWPATVEALGHTGMFDYVEFLAEYAPFDLFALDNFCRTVELLDMSAIIKVDAEPRAFLAQRGVGAGFQEDRCLRRGTRRNESGCVPTASAPAWRRRTDAA